MSKRIKTENLNLYAYDNPFGLPTFLKDWTDNMVIIDGAYVTVNGLINALDVRLTTAEETLDDLSPESIQDYKIRLNALEKKVVINTNSIKDINARLTTVNNQINAINNEQNTQNNRLTALETLTGNHTNQINNLTSNLANAVNRVAVLENCCEEVKHEISDIQNDIDGFNDDLAVLAAQFETVSNLVTELNELVQSLDLATYTARLDELRNDIDDILSDIGDTDYSDISNTISGGLVELANRIRSLTPQAYDELLERLSDAEATIGDNTSGLVKGVADNTTAITGLSADVQTNASNISGLTGDLALTNGNLAGLQTSLQDNVVAINTRINGVEAVIPSDASASNMLVTESGVGGKGFTADYRLMIQLGTSDAFEYLKSSFFNAILDIYDFYAITLTNNPSYNYFNDDASTYDNITTTTPFYIDKNAFNALRSNVTRTIILTSVYTTSSVKRNITINSIMNNNYIRFYYFYSYFGNSCYLHIYGCNYN